MDTWGQPSTASHASVAGATGSGTEGGYGSEAVNGDIGISGAGRGRGDVGQEEVTGVVNAVEEGRRVASPVPAPAVAVAATETRTHVGDGNGKDNSTEMDSGPMRELPIHGREASQGQDEQQNFREAGGATQGDDEIASNQTQQLRSFVSKPRTNDPPGGDGRAQRNEQPMSLGLALATGPVLEVSH